MFPVFAMGKTLKIEKKYDFLIKELVFSKIRFVTYAEKDEYMRSAVSEILQVHENECLIDILIDRTFLDNHKEKFIEKISDKKTFKIFNSSSKVSHDNILFSIYKIILIYTGVFVRDRYEFILHLFDIFLTSIILDKKEYPSWACADANLMIDAAQKTVCNETSVQNFFSLERIFNKIIGITEYYPNSFLQSYTLHCRKQYEKYLCPLVKKKIDSYAAMTLISAVRTNKLNLTSVYYLLPFINNRLLNFIKSEIFERGVKK